MFFKVISFDEFRVLGLGIKILLGFFLNIRYKEGIMNICNHYIIIEKEFLLPEAEILLRVVFNKSILNFQKNVVGIDKIIEYQWPSG